MIDLQAAFDSHDDEYLKFGNILAPRHPRRDVCAFLMLADLMPVAATEEPPVMVAAAEHDVIWLGVNCKQLAAVITDEQVRDLRRCGVRYDEQFDSLSLFV